MVSSAPTYNKKSEERWRPWRRNRRNRVRGRDEGIGGEDDKGNKEDSMIFCNQTAKLSHVKQHREKIRRIKRKLNREMESYHRG